MTILTMVLCPEQRKYSEKNHLKLMTNKKSDVKNTLEKYFFDVTLLELNQLINSFPAQLLFYIVEYGSVKLLKCWLDSQCKVVVQGNLVKTVIIGQDEANSLNANLILGQLFLQANRRKIVESIAPDELMRKLYRANFRAMISLEIEKIKYMKVSMEIDRVFLEGRTDDSFGFIKLTKNYLFCTRRNFTICTDQSFMRIFNYFINGSDDYINIILQSYVDLYARDKSGNTALHYLAQNHNADLFKLMRGRKFDVDARNHVGETPLFLAAKLKLFNSLKFLLENGADVNQVNYNQETVLYRLSNVSLADHFDRFEKEAVELVLQYGADPQTHKKNIYGNLNTIFDLFTCFGIYVSAESLSRAEPALARLAIIQGLGIEINELTRSKIELQPFWVQYFEKCQREVQKMMKTRIYGNITLLKFLTQSKKKITAYLRNEEFVSELARIIYDYEEESPYIGSIQERFNFAILSKEWRQKAITAVCYLINSQSIASFIIAEISVDYLSIQDMKNVYLAFAEMAYK